MSEVVAENEKKVEVNEEVVVNVKSSRLELSQEENEANANNTEVTKPIIDSPQVQQKSKILRQFWCQYRAMINHENSQLILISIISTLAVLFNLTAISTNYWSTDENQNFGLWGTCYTPNVNNSLNQTEDVNSTETVFKSAVLCAKQTVYEVYVESALQSRIDQVSASQGLVVAALILYAFSILTVLLAFKFTKEANLNSARNALVTSMFAQVISFLLQLVGFFLFIYTDHLSFSVAFLFVYFAVAIFATNAVNFITIEYKSIKYRPVVTLTHDN